MTRVGRSLRAVVQKRPMFHASLCNRHVNLTGSRCGFCSPNEARANLDCDLERCSVLVQRPVGHSQSVHAEPVDIDLSTSAGYLFSPLL